MDVQLKQRERSQSGKVLVDVVSQVIVDLLKATNSINSTKNKKPTIEKHQHERVYKKTLNELPLVDIQEFSKVPTSETKLEDSEISLEFGEKDVNGDEEEPDNGNLVSKKEKDDHIDIDSNCDESPIILTKFHGIKEPAITISDYLQRISKYSGCSDQCFIIFLIYIDRLISKKKITVDKCNIHRIVLVAILLAVKYFDDHYYDNVHYSAIGGIPLHELNDLEIEFCFLSNFVFHVSEQEFEMYHVALAKRIEANQLPKPVPIQAATPIKTFQDLYQKSWNSGSIRYNNQYHFTPTVNKSTRHLQLMAHIRNDLFPSSKIGVDTLHKKRNANIHS